MLGTLSLWAGVSHFLLLLTICHQIGLNATRLTHVLTQFCHIHIYISSNDFDTVAPSQLQEATTSTTSTPFQNLEANHKISWSWSSTSNFTQLTMRFTSTSYKSTCVMMKKGPRLQRYELPWPEMTQRYFALQFPPDIWDRPVAELKFSSHQKPTAHGACANIIADTSNMTSMWGGAEINEGKRRKLKSYRNQFEKR